MMANITFLSFLLFSMCHSIHVAVNTWLNCSFFTLIIIIISTTTFDDSAEDMIHCFYQPEVPASVAAAAATAGGEACKPRGRKISSSLSRS